MSRSSHKKIQKFPIKVQLTVNGYLRESQSMFSNEIDNPYYDISIVSNLILMFYYSMNGWDTDKCGQGLSISGLHENTVTVGDIKGFVAERTVYHTQWYHSKERVCVSFTVKINKIAGDSHNLFFGFASFDDIIDGKFYGDEKRINYAFQCNGYLWIKYQNEHPSIMMHDFYTMKLKEGDQAKFTLNLCDAKIYFSRNNEAEKVIFQNIEIAEDIRYKFAAAVFYPGTGDSATLVDVQNLSLSTT